MFIHFKNGFMLVGNRRRDYSDVYYKPDLTNAPDEDGTTPILLYSSTKPDASPQQPMEGEVMWFACFDIANCESKYKRERERLQMQTLFRAWEYLSEWNHDEVQKLEEKYDDPTFPRWQSFFRLAMKWKKQKIRHRRRTKHRREARVQANGERLEDPNSISESSDDSAYESDPAERIRARTRTTPPMAPPATPIIGKRKDTGGGHPASQRPPKRHAEDLPIMSGGLGEQDDETPFQSRRLGGPLFPSGIQRPRKESHHSTALSNPRANQTQQKTRQRFPAKMTRKPFSSSISPPAPETDKGHALALEHNGSLDENEAVDRAVRASMQPEEQHTHDGSTYGTEELRRILGASTQIEEEHTMLPTPASTNPGGNRNADLFGEDDDEAA